MTDGLVQLLVFSDDWGRHPSSCQHLVRRLLPRYPTLWVNTIGTRFPRLTMEDMGKAAAKLRDWVMPAAQVDGVATDHALPGNLSIVSPKMYPGFRRPWQRRLNARLISRAIDRAWGPRPTPETRRIAITTLPITADLPRRLDVDKWIYYCVDDFSVWPGLDSDVMLAMEAELADQAAAIVCVSDTLRERFDTRYADATTTRSPTVSILTHGIELDHWQKAGARGRNGDGSSLLEQLNALPRPVFLFWGLIDRRLDMTWLEAATRDENSGGAPGSFVFVGPQQDPDPKLAKLPRVTLPGPAAYADLPTLAAAADVLIMPYADLPVTRAMQPLKFKEYLATGKPIVARRLPATEPWADAADLESSPDEFVQALHRHSQAPPPATQQQARQRLALESWEQKAAVLEAVLLQ